MMSVWLPCPVTVRPSWEQRQVTSPWAAREAGEPQRSGLQIRLPASLVGQDEVKDALILAAWRAL